MWESIPIRALLIRGVGDGDPDSADEVTVWLSPRNSRCWYARNMRIIRPRVLQAHGASVRTGKVVRLLDSYGRVLYTASGPYRRSSIDETLPNAAGCAA